MEQPRFELCVDLATSLLAKQQLTTSMIDITTLKFDKNIIIDSMQNYCRLTGAKLTKYLKNKKSLLSDGCYIYDKDSDFHIVLYNDKHQTKEHRNWTITHEIGHIYMGHTKDGDIEEVEAHFFAAQLLMNEYVVRKMCELTEKLDPYDIYMNFNVSWEASIKRAQTIRKCNSCKYTNEDERIWQMVRNDIEGNYITQEYFNLNQLMTH